jgi:cobyrinic acid a,c-diamide synthase
MGKRPQGHGYTTLEVVRENPFFPLGARLRGHEFHYSQISPEPPAEAAMAFRLTRGTGMGGQREGLILNNVLATYTHLHALGSPQWAPALVRRAREYQRQALALAGVPVRPASLGRERRISQSR